MSGHANKSNMMKLQSFQTKALKITLNLNWFTPTSNLHSDLNLPTDCIMSTDYFFVYIIFTSLFSTCRLYKERQKSANWYNALLLRQIARDLLYALSHRHDNTCMAFVEPVVTSGGNHSVAH